MTEELAYRAVACKGWRWMPGMLFVNEMQRWRVVSLAHAAVIHKDRRPDLSDPATLGCLLALVREAWGDPRAYLCDYGGYDSVEWGVVSHEWDAKRQAEGPKAWFSCLLGDSDTEAGALVAALEAAP
jgi:hypothetical protein